MSSARFWKSVAGATGALALVLGGTGVAGAVTAAPTGAHASTSNSTRADNPMPDCHSAEHAFLGAIINCQNQHKS
jgi:hypothetical protein